jgi:hypothetical protein
MAHNLGSLSGVYSKYARLDLSKSYLASNYIYFPLHLIYSVGLGANSNSSQNFIVLI